MSPIDIKFLKRKYKTKRNKNLLIQPLYYIFYVCQDFICTFSYLYQYPFIAILPISVTALTCILPVIPVN